MYPFQKHNSHAARLFRTKQRSKKIRFPGLTVWVMVVLTVFLLNKKVDAQSNENQSLNNSHLNYYHKSSRIIQLDSLLLVPGSVVVRNLNGNDRVPESEYEVDEARSTITFRDSPPGRFTVFYRTFPSYLTRKRSKKQLDQNGGADPGFIINPYTYTVENDASALLDFGSIQYSGSFTRGISFGNNQDLVLNSGMNLQLSGMLTRDIEVVAAITDNQIPIQPQGNTARLQEFDKVFIQLSKDRHQLVVGDFNLTAPKREFLFFNRKLQGVKYRGVYELEEHIDLQADAAFAVNRGTFTTNTLDVTEGNQGPYKLTGPNGASFVIVLAGTERVFINGQLMQRGASADYVIDYNTAEITFTPGRLITADLRVVVEFEYSDRTYFRSIMQANSNFVSDKWAVGMSFYTEGDKKNQPLDGEMTAAQIDALEMVGDDLQNAFAPGVDSMAYDANRIMYALKDTFVDGRQYDSIYVFSTDPKVAHYALSFSFVGEGNGNYVPLSSNANGRVYQWVPRVGNAPAGSYEPVIKVVAPARQQMFNVNASYQLGKSTSIAGEVAMSNKDINTFSEHDNADNLGFAGSIELQNEILKPGAKNRKHSLSTLLKHRYVDHNFSQVERFRNVEFNRDWNLGAEQQEDEHFSNAAFNYKYGQKLGVQYSLGTLFRGSQYRGYENKLSASFADRGFLAKVYSSHLTSATDVGRSVFIRPGFKLEQTFMHLSGWKLGTQGLQEINRQMDVKTDTLLKGSFLFQDYQFYLASADTQTNRYRFDVALRYEHDPRSMGFSKAIRKGQTYHVQGDLLQQPAHRLSWDLTYRNFKDLSSEEQPLETAHHYLGRIDYQWKAMNGFIRSSTLYELGSGREQKKQISYQQVEPGLGDFQWLDDGDGVKELDEFVASPFRDQNDHIRIMVATTEFVSVNQTQYNQVLTLDPSLKWRSATGMKKALTQLSTSSTVQLNRKIFNDPNLHLLEPFNPFKVNVPDSLMVAVNTIIRNTLFFNRGGSNFSADANWTYQKDKNLLTNGFEVSQLQTQGVGFRWNLVKTLTLRMRYTNGSRSNFSDFYRENRYLIRFNETESRISWLYQNKLRLGIAHEYAFRNNAQNENGAQYAVVNQMTADMKYNALTKGSIDLMFSVADVGYSSPEDGASQSAFVMLQGLNPGTNYLWNVSFNRKIAKVMQLSLIYDGRKTGEGSKIVHIGRAQVSALF